MEYAVIMAGGAGTRLWPAARRDSPKQLQRLIFERPLIVETVQRLTRKYPLEHILIVTAERYAEAIHAVLPELPTDNIISEPFGRNTAAAIALAAFRISAEDPDAVFAVFPADHVMLKPDALFVALAYGHELAQTHHVVDIGVPPSHPETGYGYIELGPRIGTDGEVSAYTVKRFVEKPPLETAQQYLQAGNYMWNSGMFIWRVSEFLAALEQHLPGTFAALGPAVASGSQQRLIEAYEGIEDISVDYAIMEKTTDVVAIPVDFGWRDIGDWAALYDLMPHDEDGNAGTGPQETLDVHDSLLVSNKRLIAAIGVQDLIVVDTEDVLLIMPRSRAQDVKTILDQLKANGEEALL